MVPKNCLCNVLWMQTDLNMSTALTEDIWAVKTQGLIKGTKWVSLKQDISGSNVYSTLFKPWSVSTDDSSSCLTGKTDIDANFQACNPVLE